MHQEHSHVAPVAQEEADSNLIEELQPAIKDALTGQTVRFTAYREKWFMTASVTNEELACSLRYEEADGSPHVKMTVERTDSQHHTMPILKGELRYELFDKLRQTLANQGFQKLLGDIDKIGSSLAWAWIKINSENS